MPRPTTKTELLTATNFDSLHTTELGAERVRRNLGLHDGADVVLWCKEAARQADIITGHGKNWYVYKNGTVITINKRSNTIITAHRESMLNMPSGE